MTVPNDTSSDPSAPPAPADASTPTTPAWAEWVTATGAAFHRWLMRPRVRLTVTGAALLLIGFVIASNSVWTLPLIIIGALMVAVAWIGHRLEGRFAVEWGDSGTQLAFNATIKAPQPTTETPALSAPAPTAEPVDADVIEGEAHTVEIDVSELRALIAAAEAAEAAEAAAAAVVEATAPTGSTEAAVRDIRIRRVADDSARSSG